MRLLPEVDNESVSNKSHDWAIANRLVERIARCDSDIVRRVIVIGSWATKTRVKNSDLDLVVILEPKSGNPIWQYADSVAARLRIQNSVGHPGIPTDLSVRSIDQFESAKNFIGGVEWFAEREGLVLYSSPYGRVPNVVSDAPKIINGLVVSWLEASFLSLSAAKGRIVKAGPQRFRIYKDGDSSYHAYRSLQKTLTAACVSVQIETWKQDSIECIVEKLRRIEPVFAAQLSACLGSAKEPRGIDCAAEVFHAVIEWLAKKGPDSLFRPLIARAAAIGAVA